MDEEIKESHPLWGWEKADVEWLRGLMPALQPIATLLGRDLFEVLMSAGQANEAILTIGRRVRGNRELEPALQVLAGALQTMVGQAKRRGGWSDEQLKAGKEELEAALNAIPQAPPPSRIIIPGRPH